MNLSTAQQAAIDNGIALVTTLGPALGGGGAIAAAVVQMGATLIKSAANAGEDVTDAQLTALFDQFNANKLDDLKAQREARARGDTSGAPVPEAQAASSRDVGNLSDVLGASKGSTDPST